MILVLRVGPRTIAKPRNPAAALARPSAWEVQFDRCWIAANEARWGEA